MTHIFEFRKLFGSNTVWQYFRIESQTGHEETLFSDNESKVDMLKRVKRFYTILFAIALGVLSFNLLSLWDSFSCTPLIYILVALPAVFVIALYIKILTNLNAKVRKLKDAKRVL